MSNFFNPYAIFTTDKKNRKYILFLVEEITGSTFDDFVKHELVDMVESFVNLSISPFDIGAFTDEVNAVHESYEFDEREIFEKITLAESGEYQFELKASETKNGNVHAFDLTDFIY